MASNTVTLELVKIVDQTLSYEIDGSPYFQYNNKWYYVVVNLYLSLSATHYLLDQTGYAYEANI